MQIERLLQMVFLLVRKGRLTAGELASHFGVSKRTILRDINTLSLAGIPIYTSRGSGGGVSILKEYTIDKFLLTASEQESIINGLQVLQAASIPNTGELLTKMGALFKSSDRPSWIEVDFSFFGSEEQEKMKFNTIQQAILHKHVIQFDYFTTELKHCRREAEPLKLLFREKAWYIFAYCRSREDYRLFRTSRMKDIAMTETHFDRELTGDMTMEAEHGKACELKDIKMKFSPQIAHRVYDEYEENCVEMTEDGCFLVTCSYEMNEWLMRYLLSFGTHLEVLEPQEVRQMLWERARTLTAMYEAAP